MPLFHSTIAASDLNAIIAKHVDSLGLSHYVHQSRVYLIAHAAGGCNWNVTVNTEEERPVVGGVISEFLDALRNQYVVAPDDPDVDPPYDPASGRWQLG